MTNKHHDDTTPLETVAISADKKVKIPLGLLVTGMVSLGGGLVWCTCVWRDVQDLKRDVAEMKSILHILSPSHAMIAKPEPSAD